MRLKNPNDKDAIDNSGGTIFTIGSYKLGVNGPTSDIDALCVAPKDIDRTLHFFGMLAPKLKEIPGIKALTEVKEAFVPVIKMEFDGVEIDLLFARVDRKKIDSEIGDLTDDSILRNCDEKCVRSLAGSRDTNKILNLVPNKAHFELVLRCIKLWAKNRGIYSNVLGYFGGITWALLVAKICIDNRDSQPNKLLARFFEFYSTYPWDERYPIRITEIRDDTPTPQGMKLDESRKVAPGWLRGNLMPVITPTFPLMNSSHNVSRQTKEVLLQELEKGAIITRAILKGEKVPWNRLFKKFCFFRAFQHFIQVSILSAGLEEHDKWLGFAESKIKKIVEFLSNKGQLDFLELRTFPNAYATESCRPE